MEYPFCGGQYRVWIMRDLIVSVINMRGTKNYMKPGQAKYQLCFIFLPQQVNIISSSGKSPGFYYQEWSYGYLSHLISKIIGLFLKSNEIL